MRVLEAGDWSLLLPSEWQAERDDDLRYLYGISVEPPSTTSPE